MQETWVQSLGWGGNLEKSMANPLQYSCLDSSMDRGAWWPPVHGVAESDMTERLTHTHTYHLSLFSLTRQWGHMKSHSRILLACWFSLYTWFKCISYFFNLKKFRYNSHTIKFTFLKFVIHGVLVYLQNMKPSIPSNFRAFLSSQKETPYLSVVIPHSFLLASSCQPLICSLFL